MGLLSAAVLLCKCLSGVACACRCRLHPSRSLATTPLGGIGAVVFAHHRRSCGWPPSRACPGSRRAMRSRSSRLATPTSTAIRSASSPPPLLASSTSSGCASRRLLCATCRLSAPCPPRSGASWMQPALSPRAAQSGIAFHTMPLHLLPSDFAMVGCSADEAKAAEGKVAHG